MGMLESRLNPEWQLFLPPIFKRGAAGSVQLRGRWRRESWFIKLLLPVRFSHLCPLGCSWNHSSPSSCRPCYFNGLVFIWEYSFVSCNVQSVPLKDAVEFCLWLFSIKMKSFAEIKFCAKMCNHLLFFEELTDDNSISSMTVKMKELEYLCVLRMSCLWAFVFQAARLCGQDVYFKSVTLLLLTGWWDKTNG